MCGIFTTYNARSQWGSIEESFQRISYRGPDSSDHLHINKKLTNKALIVPSQYGEGLPRSIGEALALKLNEVGSIQPKIMATQEPSFVFADSS